MSENKTKGEKHKNDQDLQLSDNQLEKKLREAQNVNTVKSEKKVHKALTRFLSASGATDLNNWYFTETELDKWLAKFWLCVCKILTQMNQKRKTVIVIKSHKSIVQTHCDHFVMG